MGIFRRIKQIFLYFENMDDVGESKKEIRRLELKIASMEATLNIIQNSIEFKPKGEKNESDK